MYARRLVEAMAGLGGLLGPRTHGVQRQAGGGGAPVHEGAAAGAAGSGGAAEGQSGAGAHEESVQQQQQVVDEGVVRVSLLHYNTPEEVEGLIQELERLL